MMNNHGAVVVDFGLPRSAHRTSRRVASLTDIFNDRELAKNIMQHADEVLIVAGSPLWARSMAPADRASRICSAARVTVLLALRDP
jgi:hypothetical protein